MAELSHAVDKAGAAKRLAESAAKEAVDAVEETVKEDIVRNHLAWMWGGWASGLLIGLTGGFFGARKYLEPKYEKIAEDEIDQMREHFRQRSIVKDTKPDLLDLNKRVEDLGYKESSIASDPPAPGEPNVQAPNVHVEEARNVFRTKDAWGVWDYEAEKALRQEGGIYVIHRDENGETDNQELTLSYYAGDDVLCDPNDRIIEDPDRLVGNCLERFGHGSNDRNVVYIRNEKLSIDLEVIKSDKTYTEEVHGFKHENPTRKRVPRYQE